MPLIWRGLGIVVPIVFFVTGWIVSYWFGEGEATLGNSSYIGWTALYSGIVILLLGLIALASGGEEGEPKKKHDFFYLPVFVWGLLLGALSLYMLVFTGKAATPDDVVEDDTEIVVPVPTTRIVNLYNTSDEDLIYIIADETADGLISKEKVEPNSIKTKELKAGTYIFTAYNADKETTLPSVSSKEDAADEKKYKMFEDEEGKFYQRILNPMTKETDDYDEAWLMLDGKTQLLVVEITDICKPGITKEDIEAINWEDQIFETHAGNGLIEPMYNQFKKDFQIKFVVPSDVIPSEIAADEAYFLLMPYDGEGDIGTAIKEDVIMRRF